jgi:MannoseP isomerase/GMP-like beta-helix domain
MRKASPLSPLAVAKAGRDLGFLKLDADAFASARAISIDYAVMKKTSRAAVVLVACGWSDIGSWQAVWGLSEKDKDGNAARGSVVFEDSRNCGVLTDKALVALEGVDDLVVVATQDAILVSRQKDASGLKRVVAKLKAVAPEDREPCQGSPTLGGVPIGRQWRPSSGQAHHREARRPAVAAEASPSFRTLDRGPRHGARHRQ